MAVVFKKMPKLYLLIIFCGVLFAKEPVKYGHLKGNVTDAKTGLPIAWVDIYIKELNRSASTLEDGRFKFIDIPPGSYTIDFLRVGYSEIHKHVKIATLDTSLLQIIMAQNSFDTEAIVVEDHREHSHLQKPEAELSGKDMRSRMATTLAETIKDMPGLAEQNNGPAPARPVLRGLSGDRLLLLENGQRTGDLSTTSADHAVTIEPITAERIEIIRGPLTLMYGTNTLSGVINVLRNSDKSMENNQIRGEFSGGYESVNHGYASALNLEIPVNNFFFYADGSYRSASNIHSPGGSLKNTNLKTINGKTELRWQPDWGTLKAETAIYTSDYGIPPAPSELGHPNGVDIKLRKHTYSTAAAIKQPARFINDITFSYDLTDYFHEEFASSGFRDAAFSLISQHLSANTSFSNFEIFQNIRSGFWSGMRQFEAGGLTNTVNSDETSLAGWVYFENDFGNLKTSSAARIENKTITPREEKTDLRVGRIRERSFTDYAAAIKAQYGLSKDFFFSTTLIRAFRAPGIEELFADGPHLPSYAYEVGNADLKPERTYGIESGIFFEQHDLDFGLTAYYNRIDGYLFSQNTGERSWKRNDLFRYQMVGLDAVIRGIEFSGNYNMTKRLKLSSGLSYLIGDLKETMVYSDPENHDNSDFKPYKIKTNESLPFMPPLKATVDLTYDINNLSLTYLAHIAGRQYKPGRFEKSTAAYIVHGFNAEYFIAGTSLLHTITLRIENLTNETYRRHLNRIKEIFPEPGRNIKFFYKLYF